jgi:hypothetical protein
MFASVRKILLVILITVLIWVWADQALTRSLDNVPAILHVDKTTDPKLLVSFNKLPNLQVKLRIAGPSGKVDSLDKKLRYRGTLGLDFYFDPIAWNMAEPGKKYTLPLTALIRKSRILEDYDVEVESTTPENVDIEIARLVTRKLPVQVLNENQVILKDAIVEPAEIEMPVRQDYAGNALTAVVTLSSQELDQARVSPGIDRKPTVELAAGMLKIADKAVTIKLPSSDSRLEESTVAAPNIGFVLPPKLLDQGYSVQLINKTEVLQPLKIRATAEAKAAYDLTNYKLILEVVDGDEKAGEIPRQVLVNFPDEYIRKGEILFNEPVARQARFKLVQTPPTTAATAATAAATDLK